MSRSSVAWSHHLQLLWFFVCTAAIVSAESGSLSSRHLLHVSSTGCRIPVRDVCIPGTLGSIPQAGAPRLSLHCSTFAACWKRRHSADPLVFARTKCVLPPSVQWTAPWSLALRSSHARMQNRQLVCQGQHPSYQWSNQMWWEPAACIMLDWNRR